MLAVVLTRTGHDFRWYRPGMLRRRLRRRMSLHRLVKVADYITLLEQSKDEIEALKGEFLIGVTDFFRDADAWQQLADEVAPQLMAGRQPDDAPVRVWTPGCATGEETYSVAMLLLEHAKGAEDTQPVQVFGTDIDLDALNVARAGSYPESIVSSVSPERLARFFERRGDRYVVRKRLRESVLFAPQNLIRDTPFSRLDMVVCRNLLIYFEPALQMRVLELFHFALKPRGLLVLGKAESIGAHTGLFEPISASRRVFRRIGGRTHLPSGFIGNDASNVARWGQVRRGAEPRITNAECLRTHLGPREPTAAVLVDRDGRVLFFHGRIGQFLEPQGEAALDLATLLRSEFRGGVRRLLRQVAADGMSHRHQALLGAGADVKQVEIEAEAVHASQHEGAIAVLFKLLEGDATGNWSVSQTSPIVLPSEREMDDTRRELALALEDAERSNDDLRLANEESLALNEELQSSNEELESSKEELQSLNEELATVNAQLEDKIAELARNHDDLNNLLSSTHVATVLLDRDLKIRRFTPSALSMFTLQPGDEGRPLSDISRRTEDASFNAHLADVLRSGEAIEAEVRAQDGRSLLRRVLPYRSANSTLEGVVVTYIDVTQLQQTAQQARHLLAALADSNDAVMTYGLDGTILSWNEGARKAYGLEKPRDEGANLLAHVPPGQEAAVRAFLRNAIDDPQHGTEAAERLAADGSRLNVSVTATALRDDAGKPYAILSTERDVTSQLRQATEVRFQQLADDIPALLRVEDAAGHALFVNRAFAEFIGRDRDPLLGNGWLEFVHPAERAAYLDLMARPRAERIGVEFDFRLRRHDGDYRWMRSVSVPHADAVDHEHELVTLTLDVEDRTRAENALRDADQRKDEYLAMLAHELRNPLAPIRNAVGILSLTQQADPKSEWATQVIGRQTAAMARLLDDLLDVSRLAQGKVALALAPLDVALLVESAVETSRPLIDAKSQELVVELPRQPLVVLGDLLRLSQVLANLLNNAAKYTDRGGRIDVNAAALPNGRIGIRVRDNGTGIAADMLPKVFDLFAQADRTLDRAHGGLGLGLTLARKLVDIHHGEITAASDGIGKGSEFVVTLPALSGSRQPGGVASGKPGSEAQAARRVLVVDDNFDAAESLAIMLRLHGHDARVATSAASCLEMLDEFVPDAFVLDIGLPGMSGFELAKALRARPEFAKADLIALTGYGQPEDVERIRAAGFNCHLVKPASPEAVETCLNARTV